MSIFAPESKTKHFWKIKEVSEVTLCYRFTSRFIKFSLIVIGDEGKSLVRNLWKSLFKIKNLVRLRQEIPLKNEKCRSDLPLGRRPFYNSLRHPLKTLSNTDMHFAQQTLLSPENPGKCLLCKGGFVKLQLTIHHTQQVGKIYLDLSN